MPVIWMRPWFFVILPHLWWVDGRQDPKKPPGLEGASIKLAKLGKLVRPPTGKRSFFIYSKRGLAITRMSVHLGGCETGGLGGNFVNPPAQAPGRNQREGWVSSRI